MPGKQKPNDYMSWWWILAILVLCNIPGLALLLTWVLQ